MNQTNKLVISTIVSPSDFVTTANAQRVDPKPNESYLAALAAPFNQPTGLDGSDIVDGIDRSLLFSAWGAMRFF